VAESTAHVTWSGSLFEGSGTIEHVGSGTFGTLPVSWSARTGETGGQTTPEELVAAAHAACYSMALSNGLAQGGTPPDKLDVDATVTFVPGTGITKIALSVSAVVPGLEEPAFLHAAREAKDGCPLSKALAAVPEITVEATLA
jgi:osmotically inducible protein OsmC